MKSTIDSGGRVLIPKKLRDQASLQAGTSVNIRLEGGRIVLEPAPVDVRIEKRGRVYVAEPIEPLAPMPTSVVDATLRATRTRDDG